MFSILTSSDRFLANLSNLQQRIDQANRQVSSGLRVQNVSDDPSSVTDILTLDSQIAANTQIGLNLSKVQTEVSTGESALNSATQLMDRARQLATQGANGISSATTRAQLATQVLDLMNEMQGLANSQVEGRFVFGGNLDQAAPYGSVDLVANPGNGVGAYAGGTSTRTVQGPDGSNIPLAYTAQQIFDGGPSGTPANSVFQSMAELYNGLKTSNQSAIETAVADIGTSAQYLSGQQSLYGDIQNRLSDAVTYQSVLSTNLGAQLSAVQDANPAQAITTMQTENTNQQAAMAAFNALPKKSLFDFMG